MLISWIFIGDFISLIGFSVLVRFMLMRLLVLLVFVVLIVNLLNVVNVVEKLVTKY